MLLVPNNRAARAIQDAFVRRSGGGLLLPRLVPIGDPELDERIGGALEPIGEDETIPPAIEPIERQMILARLVQRASRRRRGARRCDSRRDLGRTLDQLLVEEIDPSRLATFAADLPELSPTGRSRSTSYELILTRMAGRACEARAGSTSSIDATGCSTQSASAGGPARRQASSAPPGSPRAAPAVARLLRRVARLPNGMVVLPALDLDMARTEWDALGPHERSETGRNTPSLETHPQFHLKLLLDRISVGARRCRALALGRRPRRAGRAQRAVIATPWRQPPSRGNGTICRRTDRRLSGVRALEFADPAEEAQAIALALREAARNARTDGCAGDSGPRARPARLRTSEALGNRRRRQRRQAAFETPSGTLVCSRW